MIQNIRLLFQLFPQAVLAGIVIGAVCALLGVFVILKRVVFIGVVLSEVAALGIALALMVHLNPVVAASTLTLAVVAVLAYPFETRRIPRDAVLGVIFVLASGLSVLLVAKSGFGLHEVRGLLYGDLILTSSGDLRIVLATLLPVLAYTIAFIRPTTYSFLDREAARVLGIRTAVWDLLFFLALGLAVASASKLAGALLVFCYLVVAPAGALLLSRRLGVVLVLAVVIAALSTLAGLYWSVSRDLPTNQAVAVSTCCVFVFALVAVAVRAIVRRLVPSLGSARNTER
jgi:manganese/iron transport system permease protein